MKLQLSALLPFLAASTALAKHTPVILPKEMCTVIGARRCVRQGAFENRRWVIRDCDYKGDDRVFEICPGGCKCFLLPFPSLLPAVNVYGDGDEEMGAFADVCTGAMEPYGFVRCVSPETQTTTNFHHNGINDEWGHD
ncbi:hypothetical protein SNOG_06202 [Parastagonospora nodorum SN15]|uniref:Cyanovirin-N domain-containing protein n=1 Tax=Phaeosphaeria nodorum (strain SN15 / ATCC MYA-4574 / FGSC 10173) TaxID=321614 RepID=Q0UPW2_PHANO|nr:hypothetical protein SNOG_06202 [Parastagonospora nodorum SN15]EAT86033.2 hypothetical protein SNOG_06202 [Parastagonospora nodorum SN15]